MWLNFVGMQIHGRKVVLIKPYFCIRSLSALLAAELADLGI